MLPVEIYSPERGAEFLLNNAVSAENYRKAPEVKRLGLDPDRIKHRQPPKRAQGQEPAASFPQVDN